MKYFSIILILFFNFYCSQGQNLDKEHIIQEVILSLNNKDTKKLNGLINKEVGVYIVKKIGVQNYWYNAKSINLKNIITPREENISINSDQLYMENYKALDLDLSKVEFTNKSFFKCEKIDKYGIFISSKNKYHILSESVKFYIQNYSDIIGEQIDKENENKLNDDLKKFKNIESKSHRITVNSKNGGTFIFYITNINSKWYLSIIDLASLDCSA